MPRTARWALVDGASRPTYRQRHQDDLESGVPKARAPKQRFHDAVGKIVQDGRRERMKQKLLEGIERHQFEGYRKSDAELDGIKTKSVKNFYKAQNANLDEWLEVDMIVRSIGDDIIDSFDPQDSDGDGVPDGGPLQASGDDVAPYLPEEEREKRRKQLKYARWAININVIANIALLAAKLFAITFSDSLSLIASAVDSALDLLCTLIIYTTSKLVQRRIKSLNKRFPVGRRRLEPLGILVFSIIMIVSFLQILQESVGKLLPRGDHEVPGLPPTAVFAMMSTIIVKGIIGLGCVRFESSQVQALVQDCKTDVIFNTLSLLFPFIGLKANIWWLDAVGAGLLSLHIIYDWASTCLEQVTHLTGVGADDKELKRLLYLAWRFSPVIESYKSITAYHAGDGIWCEVDLLMDEKTPLEQTHDLSETLQYCLEGLPEIDRSVG
ncbi:MAG: hypothetical protein Q9162_005959 [Coniocarpon cinnabarinum]